MANRDTRSEGRSTAAITQLEVFVEVARSGTVRRAAEVLSIAQPTATWRLQSLEQDLGLPLFDRNRGRLRLSDAGRLLLPTAERIVRLGHDLRQAAADVARGRAGRLAIAASPTLGSHFLPDVLKRFRLACPEVEVSVRTDHSEVVLQMVAEGSVQLGLARDAGLAEVQRTPLFDEDVCLVASPEDPLARLPNLRVSDCAGTPFIVYERATTFAEIVRQVFTPRDIDPRVAMEMDNIEGIKHMVERGFGLAFLPHMAARSALADGSLTRLHLADAPPLRRRIVALRPSSALPSEPETTLLALCRPPAGPTAPPS